MSAGDPHMHAERWLEDAAAYVLGALAEQELIAFRAHLQGCAICREEVSALQVVADALPAAAPTLSVPSELKASVMVSVREQASGAGATRSGRSWRLAPALRPALALGVIAALIVALVIALLPGGKGGGATHVVNAQVLAPRASATVRVSDGHAELNVVGMPQAERGRVYEVWVKRSGAPQPTDALFTVTNTGHATVAVPGNVKGVKQVLVTSEPLGGSPAPTRNPVIVASL